MLLRCLRVHVVAPSQLRQIDAQRSMSDRLVQDGILFNLRPRLRISQLEMRENREMEGGGGRERQGRHDVGRGMETRQNRGHESETLHEV